MLGSLNIDLSLWMLSGGIFDFFFPSDWTFPSILKCIVNCSWWKLVLSRSCWMWVILKATQNVPVWEVKHLWQLLCQCGDTDCHFSFCYRFPGRLVSVCFLVLQFNNTVTIPEGVINMDLMKGSGWVVRVEGWPGRGSKRAGQRELVKAAVDKQIWT